MTQVANTIRVVVPDGVQVSALIGGVTGNTYHACVESDLWIFYLSEDDARALICSHMPHAFPWRLANEGLLQRLGGVHKPKPGVNLAQMQMAAYQAMRPMSLADDLQRLRRAMGRPK